MAEKKHIYQLANIPNDRLEALNLLFKLDNNNLKDTIRYYIQLNDSLIKLVSKAKPICK
jgi:hypothetical protein